VSDPREPSKARTVLLIDDDDGVLATLQECVQALGYVAVTATTGVAGLAAARGHSPDAVLLDIAMPGAIDGVQTLKAMRAAHAELPVIMVTGNTELDVARGLLADGAFDYVMKPVGLDRLRGVLAAALMMSGKLPPA
jgi:DNA-binding NtrC family response regulator